MMDRLSTLQYNLLRVFVFLRRDSFISLDDARSYDQRPFRSLLIRQWITYRPGHGFHVTQAGRDAYLDFMSHDIARKNPRLPLTSYFDPDAYKLRRIHKVA